MGKSLHQAFNTIRIENVRGYSACSWNTRVHRTCAARSSRTSSPLRCRVCNWGSISGYGFRRTDSFPKLFQVYDWFFAQNSQFLQKTSISFQSGRQLRILFSKHCVVSLNSTLLLLARFQFWLGRFYLLFNVSQEEILIQWMDISDRLISGRSLQSWN